MSSKKAKTKHGVVAANNDGETNTSSSVEAFHGEFYTDTDSSDNDDGRGEVTRRGRLKKQRGRKPKRPKTAPPEASPISDTDRIVDEVEDLEEDIAINDRVSMKITHGLQGPQLKIDLTDIVINSGLSIKDLLRRSTDEGTHSAAHDSKKPATGQQASFTDLPPELSVEIYRKVFVTQNEPIVFAERKGFQRSSQLLRTCRKIYEQGSIVLYGENAFHFARTHAARGTYFEPVWKDIGYKDVRRFFHDIGSRNIAKLKYISFEFEDALPTFTPRHTQEERRYVNDAMLLKILQLIAKHTTLEKFGVGFRGKSNLNEKDYHFLKALSQVRCYEINSDTHRCLQKVELDTYNRLKRLVEIKADEDNNVDKTKNKFAPRMFTTYGRRYGFL